jgi:hypothetical protein
MSSKNRWSKLIACALLVIAPAMGTAAQDTRFTNNQYNVAFQPPSGWAPTILVQYEGPQRPDGGHPALSLSADDHLIDISEDGTNKLADEFLAEFSEGFEDAKIIGRRKLPVAGLDALQMDLSFKGDLGVIQIRRVFIPVKQQNRTYIFTLSDSTDHFGESDAAGDNAVASFAFLQTGSQPGTGAAVPPASGGKSPAYNLMLVLIGLAALAIVVGTAYLLTRKRHDAGSSEHMSR